MSDIINIGDLTITDNGHYITVYYAKEEGTLQSGERFATPEALEKIGLQRIGAGQINPNHDQRRFEAACAAMQGLLSDPFINGNPDNYTKIAVKYADALLAELAKKEGE